MGMVEIKSAGKNLWNGLEIPYETYGGSSVKLFELTQNSLKVYIGPKTSDNWYYISFVVPVAKGKTYTFSANINVTVINGQFVMRLGSRKVYAYSTTYSETSSSTSKSYFYTKTFTTVTSFFRVSIYKANLGEFTVSLDNIQLEENSTATGFEPYLRSKISFDTELYSFGNAYDYIKDDTVFTRFTRMTTTTNSSGNFSLSGYLSGSKVVVVNNTTGEVKILDAASTISTGWNNTSVTVIYATNTANSQKLSYDGELILKTGKNNLILPDCGTLQLVGNRKYLEG